MKIIDMHCDTLLEGWRKPEISFLDGNLSVNLNLLKKSGCMAQFFAIWLPREEMKTMDSYDILKSIYGYYCKVMEENSGLIKPAYSRADIENNHKNGILSSFLTVEDGVFLDGKIERLTEAYDMGVRLLTLLWNYENSVGFPNSDDPEVHMKGLKPFGIEVVEKMNQLGMIIDVSHLSEGGFYDVKKYSSKPFVASHSCARALCNHRRNLTDHQLKVLGEAGGVVGVNFESSFLQEGLEGATFELIIRHLLYMRDKAGIEAIGFGSDFDGIENNGELVNYGGFISLLERMEKYFTDDEIDKISSGNALRVMGDIL